MNIRTQHVGPGVIGLMSFSLLACATELPPVLDKPSPHQLQRQEQESRVREHELMFQEQILRTRLMELENRDQQHVPSDPPTHGSNLEPRPPTAQAEN